jgi:hypothetical protein
VVDDVVVASCCVCVEAMIHGMAEMLRGHSVNGVVGREDRRLGRRPADSLSGHFL